MQMISQIVHIASKNPNNLIYDLRHRLSKVGLLMRVVQHEGNLYLIIEEKNNIRHAGAKRKPLVDSSGNIITCADIFKMKAQKQSNQFIATNLFRHESHSKVNASTISRRIKQHRINNEFFENSTTIF